MKFLTPLACCFYPAVPQQEVTLASSPSLHNQETRSLMPRSSSSSVENDHFPAKNKPSSSVNWKPALCAISEDKVVCVLAAGKTVTSGGKSKAKTTVYKNSHHYRRPTPTVFQTVAPVAFIF